VSKPARPKKCVRDPANLRAVSSLVFDAPTTHELVGHADRVNETWGAVQRLLFATARVSDRAPPHAPSAAAGLILVRSREPLACYTRRERVVQNVNIVRLNGGLQVVTLDRALAANALAPLVQRCPAYRPAGPPLAQALQGRPTPNSTRLIPPSGLYRALTTTPSPQTDIRFPIRTGSSKPKPSARRMNSSSQLEVALTASTDVCQPRRAATLCQASLASSSAISLMAYETALDRHQAS